MNIVGPGRVLEVGCNTGMNLGSLPAGSELWGIDVNQRAVNIARVRHKEANIIRGSGFDIPFRDAYFDFVFTAGVLIHQPPDEVELMMQEIMRVSGQFVMAVEYYSEMFEEVPYRGKDAALFKGPFGDIYEKKYGMRMVKTWNLGKREGFDDCRAWLLST